MQKHVYLEGLSSLRFFLAIFVVIGHCNQNLVGIDIYWYHEVPFFFKGGLAVDGFFILSGFLLTYLASIEFKKRGYIDVKHFFIRRILRIFPLYYFAVFLGFMALAVIYPYVTGTNYFDFTIGESLPYYLVFLPNWISAKYTTNIGSLFSLWSIGVEEQFYLFFPFLIPFILKSKRPILILSIITLTYYLLYLYFVNTSVFDPMKVLSEFIFTLKFHLMLLGGVFALIFSNYKDKITRLLTFKAIQFLLFILIILLFFTSWLNQGGLINGVILSLFIISVTNKSTTLFNLENTYLKHLGVISFGIYIYHPLVSYPLRFFLLKNLSIFSLVSDFPILYYVAEILFTTLVAHLSYKYYELWFINLKAKYK